MTRILLVRHGQTEWNRVERFRGRADVPLNEAGIAQAEAAARRIAAEWAPSAVYTSPLGRAVRTARAIAAPFGLDVRPHPDLNDIDFGSWQGLTPDEARARWPEAVEAWVRTPQTARLPGGESLAGLAERSLGAVRELAGRHDGETIVIVGHTVLNRALILAALGLGLDLFWRIRQDTAALNVLEFEDGVFSLAALNDTCHLPGRPPKAV